MQQLSKQELLELKPGDCIRKEHNYPGIPLEYQNYHEYKVISNKNNQLRVEFKYQNRICRTRITINNTFRDSGTQVLYPSQTKIEYRFYKID